MSDEAKANNKKPIYKKVWFWVVIILLVICLGAAGGASNKSDSSDQDNIDSSYTYEEGTDERKLEEAATKRIKDNYEKTDIDHITVNKDAGTNDEDDYIILAYVKWNRENKLDTTKEMLRTYCDDFAAGLGKDYSSVSEVVMFWEVPYHSGVGTSKCSYERKNNVMVLSDKTNLIGDK